MSKLDLGGTVKRTKAARTQRSHKVVNSKASERTKALNCEVHFGV